MINSKPRNQILNGRFAFFQEFLKHPLQIGSIIPSSRFLEQRVLKAADVTTASTIIELGPGTGGTTRAILREMPQHARLLSIEINPHFYSMLSNISDDRFIAHLGSASELLDIMHMYDLNSPDAVISGIPFSTINRDTGSRILSAIESVLGPHGRFVAYQVSDRVAQLCQPYFGKEQMSMELLNIPPMRIYQWEKREYGQDNLHPG